ncbi:MAG: dockerin type I domain-containing protein [Candidatus Roizmanbacteria bacterium]
MKKELPKIIIIFLIVIGLVIWAWNYIFLGSAPKSKAAGEKINYIFVPASITKSSGDFTTSVKIKPSIDMTIRGYQFNITFDKTKILFKSIEYKLGAVSVGIGDDNSKKTVINQNGKIKVVGEIQSATGKPILKTENTEVVTITFTASSSQSSSIITGLTDAKIFMIKTDYSLFDVPSAGQAKFSVNGGGTGTGTPTPTPTGGVNATLNLKLKFQGISTKPKDALNKLKVKLRLYDENTEKFADSDSDNFTANENGIWSGDVVFNGVFPTHKYVLLVKGPYHIQKKVCVEKPTETAAGTYRCIKGIISLVKGNNNLDLSGITLLAGDLPDQDGTVSSYDTSLIRNNLGKTDDESVANSDVNRDGIVDTQDYSLIIASLSVKNDEE